MIAVFCVFAPKPVFAESLTFEVMPFGFADPDTVIEAARSLVGEDGTVILDRNHRRLLVRARESEQNQIRALLEQLGGPPRNVRVDVDIWDASETEQRGAALEAEGEVVIIGRDASGRIRLRPSVTHRTERTRSDTRQSLLVASGREAVLRVGERVPRLQWINRWGVLHGMYSAEVVWEDVGAFLIVQPDVIGDGEWIRIRLIPELSGRVDGRAQRIRFTQAATEVVVPDGQTVSLGGLATSDEFYSRFLIGVDRTGTQRTLDIRLTARLVDW